MTSLESKLRLSMKRIAIKFLVIVALSSALIIIDYSFNISSVVSYWGMIGTLLISQLALSVGLLGPIWLALTEALHWKTGNGQERWAALAMGTFVSLLPAYSSAGLLLGTGETKWMLLTAIQIGVFVSVWWLVDRVSRYFLYCLSNKLKASRSKSFI